MTRTMHAAAAGLAAQQQKIDTIANNIANVHTTGFKRSRLDFADTLYAALQNPALPTDQQNGNLQFGQGVLAQGTTVDRSAGQLEISGRSLDLALIGDGFFMIETGGQVAYTRDGVFNQTLIDGRNYLVTTNGDFVLDQAGERISAETSFDQVSIDSAGRITVAGTAIGELGLVNFVNPAGLEARGQNAFQTSATSGDPIQATAEIRQGCVEGSNVSLADEMTGLIEAQRAYALMSRAITTADQMRANENEIRR